MAQTKRKRRSKHRGNAAGVVEARGRTGRPGEVLKDRKVARNDRLSRPPSWTSAANRAAIAAVLFVVVVTIIGQSIGTAVAIGGMMFLLYVPLGYYTDQFLYNRRMAKKKP